VLIEWSDGEGAARVLARNETALQLERAIGLDSLTDLHLRSNYTELAELSTSLFLPHFAWKGGEASAGT
jgi:streptomycin 6-kinase